MATFNVKRLRWPPAGLGLGTPLNSVLTSASNRSRFFRFVWLFIAIGVLTAVAILALDQLLFAGASLPRIRTLRSEPVFTRVFIILFSALVEELIYRVLVSTLVAWLALLVFSRFTTHAEQAALWLGIIAGAVLFGLAHVANVSNTLHPVLRALVLNGVAGVVLGWLYWKRGLEAAITAHLSADALIYFIVASFI